MNPMIHVGGLVQVHDGVLHPELVPTDQVRPHPDNPWCGDSEAIGDSIQINGMYRPLYAQRSTGYILAGNHTYAAACELGAETVPVIWLDMDDAALRTLLADNRIAQLGRYDDGLLLPLLVQMRDNDSLLGTGWTERDVETLQALSEIEPDYDDHATWPTVCFQVPPHVRRAFYDLTETAVGDRERFELLLRLAGWDGKKP
jgi:ParB/Sulfiredoxin domain